MKTLLLSFAVASLVVVAVQAPQALQAAQNPGFSIQGNSVQIDGPVRHARGNVTFSTDSIEIRADQLDFNSATGELEANGHVTVVSTQSVSPDATGSRTALQPQLDAAQTRLARSQELIARGLVGRADLQRAQQQLDQVNAQLAAQSGVAKSKIDAAQLKLSRSTELADRGLLSRRDVDVAQQQLDQLKLEAGGSPVALWTLQSDSLRMQIRLTR